MNSPLEPIPTTKALVVQTMPATSEKLVVSNSRRSQNSAVDLTAEASGLTKAYPWLLATSVCLSGVLCWMYVTKPVIAPAAPVAAIQPSVSHNGPSGEPNGPLDGASLIPSDSALPGASPVVANRAAAPDTGQPGSPVNIDPRKLAAMSGDSSEAGWESTNLKVQHILSADSGNGQLEKIILDVPVRYETRTMRWTVHDIEKARDVLGRLMIYERDLNNLRKQGVTILQDWNTLLEHTVPAPALRADSPSIPYNHGHGYERGSLPDSSTVIQVDNPAADPVSDNKAQSKN